MPGHARCPLAEMYQILRPPVQVQVQVLKLQVQVQAPCVHCKYTIKFAIVSVRKH